MLCAPPRRDVPSRVRPALLAAPRPRRRFVQLARVMRQGLLIDETWGYTHFHSGARAVRARLLTPSVLADEAEAPLQRRARSRARSLSVVSTLSDTRMVCDWSHPPQLSEDTLALHPRCVHGVVPGPPRGRPAPVQVARARRQRTSARATAASRTRNSTGSSRPSTTCHTCRDKLTTWAGCKDQRITD